MQQLPKIFVPVSVKNRLPDKYVDGIKVILQDDGPLDLFNWAIFNPVDGGVFIGEGGTKDITADVTHWIEEREDVIVCSQQDLVDLWYQSRKVFYGGTCGMDENAFDAFLISKGIKL